MTKVKVTCNCGAIYEVIETKGPSRERKRAHADAELVGGGRGRAASKRLLAKGGKSKHMELVSALTCVDGGT